jgi:hypothetical protein
MANTFLTELENIGKHIVSGFEKAAPIIAKVATALEGVPVVGPALAEVGAVITDLEKAGSTTFTAADIEQIVVALVTALQIKTAASTGAASTAAAPATTTTAAST